MLHTGLLPSPPTAAGAPPSAPPAPLSRDGGDFTKFDASAPPNRADVPGGALCVLVCVFIAAGLKPAVRRRFHAFLGSLAVQGESKAAAAVAGLVGGRSPDDALKHGAATFLGLPFDSLSVADFKTNADTGLHSKTVKASLGDVDAFLSHSWHDDAEQKWGALEKWSSDKGKSSTVWLDKVRGHGHRPQQAPAGTPSSARSSPLRALTARVHTYTHLALSARWTVPAACICTRRPASINK